MAFTFTKSMTWNVLQGFSLTQSMTWGVATPAPLAFCASPIPRCNLFQQVTVDHLVEGISRVTWSLSDTSELRGPLTYQLQVGDTGNPLAEDWQDVGQPAENVFSLADPTRRDFGQQMTVHYRIKLVDGGNNAYVSAPATPLGNLNGRDWLNARETLRQQSLRFSQLAGVCGYLLKRRRSGLVCKACVDSDTGEVTNADCQVCYGTRYAGGYFRPMPLQYAEMPLADTEEKANAGVTGWSRENKGLATFLGLPILSSRDVWIDGSSDRRYHIGRIAVKAQIRSLPLVVAVQLEQLDFNHIVYKIPLGGP